MSAHIIYEKLNHVRVLKLKLFHSGPVRLQPLMTHGDPPRYTCTASARQSPSQMRTSRRASHVGVGAQQRITAFLSVPAGLTAVGPLGLLVRETREREAFPVSLSPFV